MVMAHHNLDRPWLFVVPASLKITLSKEIQKWARMKVVVAYSTFKMENLKKNVEVIIVNYDILNKLQNEFIGKIGGIIFDECHYLANVTSQRTIAALAITQSTDKVILMSGTLLKNKPAELWPLLYMIDNRTWRDKGAYYSRYCKPSISYGELVYDGATNLDELHNRVKPYLFYKPLEEILPELPPVQDMFYSVEITDKEFIKANREIEELIEAGKFNVADNLEKMQELSRSAFFHKRSAFYESVDDYIEETGEKVVLVGVHKAVIADMVEKYKCDYISGSVPAQNRNAIIERFHTSDKKVLVLQLEAGSTGFSILCSRTMFFGEVNYSPSTLSQMKGRVRRMNTVADKCLYYFFIGQDTLEERMMKLMAKKEVISSQVITGAVNSTLKDVKYEILLSD
jgi:SNF2 family DNA or RNA helicase